MSLYKEIVTKAVIGKGKKYFKDNYSITLENTPTTILGCWVINHKFKGYKTNEKIGAYEYLKENLNHTLQIRQALLFLQYFISSERTKIELKQQLNDEIKNEEVSLDQKIKHYSTVKMADNGRGMMIKGVQSDSTNFCK